MKKSLSKASRFIIFGVIYTLVWCFPAYADVNSSEKWAFQIAPYIWMAGQNGMVATLPACHPPILISISMTTFSETSMSR
ncbi:MAG: hypothetical protein JRK53_26465 [Deltaproteobacteria bacterium]|nr:hypothetical protein [Deltaproteobacteria bacterium]